MIKNPRYKGEIWVGLAGIPLSARRTSSRRRTEKSPSLALSNFEIRNGYKPDIQFRKQIFIRTGAEGESDVASPPKDYGSLLKAPTGPPILYLHGRVRPSLPSPDPSFVRLRQLPQIKKRCQTPQIGCLYRFCILRELKESDLRLRFWRSKLYRLTKLPNTR